MFPSGRAVGVVLTLALTLVVWALTPCATFTARAQEVPFVGIIVEDDVSVRAGQGREYYVVGTVETGTLVDVQEVVYGWYKISPPPGVHSYVSKGFVRARGDGTTGVVSGDNAWVKAAGVDRAPHLSYQKQLLLTDGQTVGIVGEKDDFYLIVPPPGAYVFVSPTALRRATPDEIAAAREVGQAPALEAAAASSATAATADANADAWALEESPAAAPTSVSADEPSAVAPVAAQTPTPPTAVDQSPAAEAPAAESPTVEPELVADAAQVADEAPDATPVDAVAQQEAAAPVVETPAVESLRSDAVSEAPAQPADGTEPMVWPTVFSPSMKAAEAAYQAVFDQPVEQQPLDQLIANYQAVVADAAAPRPDRQIATARISQLRRNERLADTLRRLDEMQGQLAVRSTDEVLAGFRERQARAAAEPRPYDAVGRLLASGVYDGVNLPRLYRVVDPATSRTIAYLEPAASPQTKAYLGEVIGVVGPMRFDPGLRLKLIEPDRIDLLEHVSE